MPLNKLHFKYSWRSYQQQFLDGFESHIIDNHLHVIAPPGSGKTILGIEILRRIGKPTLVLAPTLTIRNQWRDRLLDFFDDEGNFEEYSLNIKKPKLITFSTYQSLFALYKSFSKSDSQSLVNFIQEHGIETLVLDEAHHLKNEWWHCLFQLKALKNLTIVSLTATPPYDSSAKEINRYFDLCGPVDDEIAVPDLIKNGDLCPHQDFIYFSYPNEAQIKYIITYREQILDFTNRLLENKSFQKFLMELEIYKNPSDSLELIYQNPSFYSSVLIYLKSTGIQIDKNKLTILGFEENDTQFPSFSYEWAENLLQTVLVTNRSEFIEYENLLLGLEKELRRIGVFSKRRVDFVGDQDLYRNLASSPSKLKSIDAILRHTLQSLGVNTRAVILTDFIRKEFLDFKGQDCDQLNKLGVVPIFYYLKAKKLPEDSIGVLTGSLIIIHKKSLARLNQIIDKAVITGEELVYMSDYIAISIPENAKSRIVAAITQLFEEGIIKILIGTKSLLGEGWDAPSINTLVLASYVGSFVSSNQMRGRAIRIDADFQDKTGNIWHLACLDPTADDGGKDMEKLKQRFEAFSGVSLTGEPYIQNGLERLDLPQAYDESVSIRDLNKQMVAVSKTRSLLKSRWEVAISKGSILTRELRVPYAKSGPFEKQKRLTALNAAKYLSLEIMTGLAFFLPEFFVKNFGTIFNKGALTFFYILLGAIITGFGPKTLKAIKVYLRFGNQFKKTKKIAIALLTYLRKNNLLAQEHSKYEIVAEQENNGTFSIILMGANQHDSNLFISLLDEIIAPINNPRYLLVSKNWFKNVVGLRNYYVVPSQFAKKKSLALDFQKVWNSEVDGSKLLFTRTLEGRKHLLKARFAHLRYEFEELSKKTTTWK